MLTWNEWRSQTAGQHANKYAQRLGYYEHRLEANTKQIERLKEQGGKTEKLTVLCKEVAAHTEAAARLRCKLMAGEGTQQQAGNGGFRK